MKYRIHRRTFLRGAAGALLPLPWLNLMEASVKTRSQASPPLRFHDPLQAEWSASSVRGISMEALSLISECRL